MSEDQAPPTTLPPVRIEVSQVPQYRWVCPVCGQEGPWHIDDRDNAQENGDWHARHCPGPRR